MLTVHISFFYSIRAIAIDLIHKSMANPINNSSSKNHHTSYLIIPSPIPFLKEIQAPLLNTYVIRFLPKNPCLLVKLH